MITCFIPYLEHTADRLAVLKQLQQSKAISDIKWLAHSLQNTHAENLKVLATDSVFSSSTMQLLAKETTTPYILLYTKHQPFELGYFAIERLLHVAQGTPTAMVYSDYYELSEGIRKPHPNIHYQAGSLRDDFCFGSLLLLNTELVRQAVAMERVSYAHAGFYDMRLKLSELGAITHLNEYLYAEIELDNRKSGEKQFDYVDPKNRAVQIEMEQACTEHLKRIGGYLPPTFKKVRFSQESFPVEASVIIPVRNRERTIEEAIQSVLNQKTDFRFNLIIINNYSTDRTEEIIEKYVQDDKRVIHLIPERTDLGIGGCWNVGVHHPMCGKFAVQLDSDDLYQNKETLQTMVNAFYEQECAMVVGSYTMTNVKLEPIPPGLIDHKEWTPENGRNNALRINGLGAPRAFYTPLLRDIKVPNTSYGEDYALGLYFSRNYQIGRVYHSVYLCRRWDDNSDAFLDITKTNAHNLYKDRIRTIELQARIAMQK